MSEPVKSVEIEDVLSSIRRLVSENHRQPSAPAEDAPARAPERLVLTDALRVPDPQPETDHSEEGQTDGEDPLVLEAPQEVAEERDPDHADHAGAEHHDDHNHDEGAHHDHQPDHDDPAPDHKDNAQQGDDHHADHHHDDHAHDENHHDTQNGDHHVSDDHGSDDHHHDDPTHAQPEHDQSETAEMPPEPTAHDDHGTHEPAAEPAPGAEGVPWSDPNATLYEAAGLADAADSPGDAPQEDIRPLGEKIAALEEVIGRTDDQWEPDDAGIDEYAGTEVETLEWEDTDLDPFADSYTPDPPPFVEELVADPAEPDHDDDAQPDALLDEAALRDLVADIVREELQGVLGERITRNVRKLVRREIHRALTVRDLE